MPECVASVASMAASTAASAASHKEPHVCAVCFGEEPPFSALQCGHVGHKRCFLLWAVKQTSEDRKKPALPLSARATCPLYKCLVSRIREAGMPPAPGEELIATPESPQGPVP